MTSPRGGSRLGTRFGPYELRSLLGAGGMGEVYRAFDTVKGRMVAVKLLRPEMAADPTFQERFRRESRVAARLQDPHVIPVHDFGEIDGVLFIDMRLVDGGSLKDLIRRHGPLSPALSASIITQIASALDAAHADELVHRDVKPENVLLTARNFAYLVDFGIARSGGDASVTSAGAPIGSYLYMAPERFTGEQVGPAADVYSLTCVLYECLTGGPPFEFAEPQQVMHAQMFSAPPRPSIMRRGIDRAFDGIIATGMAKQPAARFVSAGELARAVTAAVGGATASPPSGTRPFAVDFPNPNDSGYSPYPPAEAPAVPARSARLPVVLGVLAVLMLVVAAVLAIVLAFGGGSGPSAPSALPTTSATPSLSRAVDGADGLGFIGHAARCDYGNPAVAVGRTALSLVVICQAGQGSFYYRGERLSDRANISLGNAVPASGGFDVTNPANGVRYEVRPSMLTIISGSHVDSAEPMLQYASGG